MNKNVILITIDCCRQDVFGCYGSKANFTPFIDSLQDKCTVFTEAHAVGPYTKASFPGILASSYCFEHGWQAECAKEWVLVSEVLARADIATAGFHSNPYLSRYFGWDRDWFVFMDSMKDKVTSENPYLKGAIINKRIEKWLNFHGGNANYKPFFLWVHYMDVHEPYVPQRRHLDLVDDSINLDQSEMFALYKEVLLKRDATNPDTVAILRKLYCAHVIETDEYVRDLFNILTRLKLAKDTVVIITSDHGDEFGEHGSLSHDSTMYSELVHIPLMIYEENGQGPIVCDTVVSNADIPPTVAKMFDIGPSEKWKGQSLIPIEKYKKLGVFGEAPEKTGDVSPEIIKEVHYYREGDLKIIYHEANETWEMYDLSTDVKELTNIINEAPEADDMKVKIKSRVSRNLLK